MLTFTFGSEDTMSNRLEAAPVERVAVQPNIVWPSDEHQIINAAQRLRSQYVGTLFGKVAAHLRAKIAEFGQTLADARSARVLSEMTDRELADIGLTRGDIAAIAAGKSRHIAEERTLHVERLTRTRAAV
jgi:uncharacterized protein YjiS (DUF1127 family)